ncbi:hypothetical protein [Teredinibacter haidensis]|uniref:hypothetical protein n=1 Tax=Teredinibacter haidensis TaxID=2731755 RepID=UPI001C8EABFB|nr:hypothetical protein [Teredinibacter haidensis]
MHNNFLQPTSKPPRLFVLSLRSLSHKKGATVWLRLSKALYAGSSSVTKCRLCEEEKDLELSHIIPKFVFRHLKKTSPTGNIRSTENPNKSTQDGLKIPFLCGDCEDLFSVWETKFANEIFFKYQDGSENTFSHDTWLTKYLASVSFRVLSYAYHEVGLDYFDEGMLRHVPTAIDRLRNYLLGKSTNPGEQRQLLLLLDKASEPSDSDFNMYLVRGIEHDVLTTDKDSFVYIKYLKFLQLCPIKLSSNKGWKTARISPNKGTLAVKDHELPDYVSNRLRKGTEILTSSRDNISEKQASIICSRVKAVPTEKLLESPVAKAASKHDI